MIDLKKWKIGEYVRELSIITIGIAITFCVTHIISNINTKNALKEELVAIDSELSENERELDEMLDFYHALSKYRELVEADKKEKVNPDSIRKYQYTLTTMVSFNYKRDAFDMLKYSGRLKDIKNQSHILNIMECYRLMEQAKEVHDTYMQQKMQLLHRLLDRVLTDDIDLSKKENISLYNFIIGYNGMDEGFKSSKQQIEKVLSLKISEN